MEIQISFPITHAGSFITPWSLGWMSFNITIKCLFLLSKCFITCGDTSVQIWTRQQKHMTVNKVLVKRRWTFFFRLSQPLWCYLHPAAWHTICICYQSKNLAWNFNEQRNRGSSAKERICWRQCGIVLAKRNGQEAGNLGEEEQSLRAFAFHMWM